ncbi:MAG TPA: RNA polymerase factor sigma-54 [Pseudogracilibacillus sp.]|nr:RNA polymerase factor sigma-54 [Pseudogracilibacillus sp.]
MTLEQRQTLKMVMTTELRQAIELLQLTNYELKLFIEKEVEENPFIELVEKHDNFSYSNRSRYNSAHEEEVDPFEFISDAEPSLYDYLLKQVNVLHIKETKRSILHFLVLNLNDSGYLTMSNEEISQFLNVSSYEVECARQLLLSLDPIGSGARDINESLLIQAKKKYPEDEFLHSVIEYDLENLANRKWSVVAERLHISRKEVAYLLAKIQTLQPKPAMNFSTTETNYVTPDIIVELADKKDSFNVTLNNYYVPNIRFNNEYASYLGNSSEIKSYVSEHYKKYNWLRQSIEQRRQTILKIMEVVLRKQRNFFTEGFRGLKPLTLQDVAGEIDMHESTVSRATANKIVETPNGTFELRQLFSTGVTSAAGVVTSQTKVKELLQEIVQEENKERPLSDQKIAELLKEEYEVAISRRTVAKYRDELNIPSSTRRKELLPT